MKQKWPFKYFHSLRVFSLCFPKGLSEQTKIIALPHVAFLFQCFLYHKNIPMSAHVINLPSNFLQVDIRLDFAKSNSQRAIATSIFTNLGERIQNYSLLLWFRSNSRQPLHLLRKKKLRVSKVGCCLCSNAAKTLHRNVDKRHATETWSFD